MSAREIMAKVFSGAPYPSKRTYDRVTDVLDALTDAGYVILSPDEVRGIRDGALEEAAKEVEDELVGIYEDSPDIDIECNNLVRRAAAAIRSLKGGRDGV